MDSPISESEFSAMYMVDWGLLWRPVIWSKQITRDWEMRYFRLFWSPEISDKICNKTSVTLKFLKVSIFCTDLTLISCFPASFYSLSLFARLLNVLLVWIALSISNPVVEWVEDWVNNKHYQEITSKMLLMLFTTNKCAMI